MKLNYAKQSGDTAAINEMFDSRIICCLELGLVLPVPSTVLH